MPIRHAGPYETWRKRFETMAKPLSRAESMVFWSDRNIKAGEWEKQIESAMKGAVAALLLVSDNFLASDYIVQKELPYHSSDRPSGRFRNGPEQRERNRRSDW